MRTGRELAWVLILAAPQPAQAQGRALDLTVENPPGAECVTSESLRARVEARVGPGAISDAVTAARRVDVRIAPTERGFSAAIRALDAQGKTLGERSLSSEADTCESLERPIVLVISTLIGIAPDDAGKTDVAPEQEWLPQPTPTPRAPPERDESPPAIHSPPPEPSEPFHFGVSLGGGAESGLLPGVAPTGAVRLVARRSWLAFRVGAGAAPRADRDLGGPARATFRSGFGDADLCALTPAGVAKEFAFCGGARGGAIFAETRGLYGNARTVRPFVELTVRARLEVSVLPRHSVSFELGGALPVLPETYVFIENDGRTRQIHTTNLGLLAEIGWLWRFGS